MDGWIVGAEVVERIAGWGSTRYGPRRKIGKVYASGNFVLEGEKQQYRPRANSAGKTGEDRWSRSVLVLVTPEVEADIERANAVAKARRAVIDEYERLQKIVRGNSDDEILAAAASLPSSTNPGADHE